MELFWRGSNRSWCRNVSVTYWLPWPLYTERCGCYTIQVNSWGLMVPAGPRPWVDCLLMAGTLNSSTVPKTHWLQPRLPWTHIAIKTSHFSQLMNLHLEICCSSLPGAANPMEWDMDSTLILKWIWTDGWQYQYHWMWLWFIFLFDKMEVQIFS